jgi:hypothetical protein
MRAGLFGMTTLPAWQHEIAAETSATLTPMLYKKKLPSMHRRRWLAASVAYSVQSEMPLYLSIDVNWVLGGVESLERDRGESGHT